MLKKYLLIITLTFTTAVMLYAQEMNDQELKLKVNEIVEALTLEEKASLCSGRDDWSTEPIERLDIPWIWVAGYDFKLVGNLAYQAYFPDRPTLIFHFVEELSGIASKYGFVGYQITFIV